MQLILKKELGLDQRPYLKFFGIYFPVSNSGAVSLEYLQKLTDVNTQKS